MLIAEHVRMMDRADSSQRVCQYGRFAYVWNKFAVRVADFVVETERPDTVQVD